MIIQTAEYTWSVWIRLKAFIWITRVFLGKIHSFARLARETVGLE